MSDSVGKIINNQYNIQTQKVLEEFEKFMISIVYNFTKTERDTIFILCRFGFGRANI